MGFVAAEAVVELEFDFRGFDKKGNRVRGWPEELFDVHGVTPEPSQDQVRDFHDAIRRLYKIGEYEPPVEELAEKVAKSLSLTEITERDEQVARIYAAVCSGEPSAEQILALPHRQRAAFIGYLSGELLNPTAGSPATNS